MENLVESLEKAVEELIGSNAELRAKLRESEEERQSLLESLSQKDRDIEQLETKMKALKMANSLAGSGTDDKEVRKVLNEFVRDIDKCIALLNG